MARNIEYLTDTQTLTKDDEWVIAKPIYKPSLIERLKDAIGVFTGKYTAVCFVEDIDEDFTEYEDINKNDKQN